MKKKRSKKSEYTLLHIWVSKKLGKPKYCEHCKSTKKEHYDWANVSKKYKKDVADFIRLCRSCHIKYDKGQRCIRGHKLKGVNVYTRKDRPTWRVCRACQSIFNERAYQNRQK